MNERFDRWLAEQATVGAHGMRPRKFTDDQRHWLEMIRDHIATSLAIEMDDFDDVPFGQRGGLGKAYQVFGHDLGQLMNELNEALVM